jgi:type IV secretory pathway protease TraF
LSAYASVITSALNASATVSLGAYKIQPVSGPTLSHPSSVETYVCVPIITDDKLVQL